VHPSASDPMAAGTPARSCSRPSEIAASPHPRRLALQEQFRGVTSTIVVNRPTLAGSIASTRGNRELIPSGSGMTSLMAAHALSFLRSFLSLSLCLIDDYGSDPAPLASDRFADLEIEIGELSRGASARDATCVTSKVQNCN